MKIHVNNVLKKYDMKSHPESLVNEGALIRAKSAKAIDAVINEGQSLNTVISNFEKQR